MTKQAWPQPCALERVGWAGTSYSTFPICSYNNIAWHKAERITQGFPAMKTVGIQNTSRGNLQQMHAVSIFACTVGNNATTTPHTPQNRSGGQEIAEKGHRNNQIHVKWKNATVWNETSLKLCLLQCRHPSPQEADLRRRWHVAGLPQKPHLLTSREASAKLRPD